MAEDVDTLADDLLSGKRPCDGCESLQNFIKQVKEGQMNIDEFKNILRMNKEELLSKTV